MRWARQVDKEQRDGGLRRAMARDCACTHQASGSLIAVDDHGSACFGMNAQFRGVGHKSHTVMRSIMPFLVRQLPVAVAPGKYGLPSLLLDVAQNHAGWSGLPHVSST